MKNTILQILLVTLFLPHVVSAAPKKLKDMVLVQGADGQLFYIDIFEVTWDAAAAIDSRYRVGSAGWKPMYNTDKSSIEEVCKLQGKRLPTKEEWLSAASGNGTNSKYTLRGDTLYDQNKKLIPHVANNHGGNAVASTDIKLNGIDVSGTVGMTGNRAEWVDSAVPMTCGSYYGQADLRYFELNNTCTTDRTRLFEHGAGGRCVIDYDDNIEIEYSDNVTKELLDYLETLVSDTDITELLIPSNDYTKASDEQKRLSPPVKSN